jgi:prepilin-type N-terminal cleavage/methylation domain-containing protein
MRTVRRRSGFTLVELIVAVAIMAAIATALGHLLSTLVYQGVKSRLDQKIKAIIAEQVDYCNYVRYSALVTASETRDLYEPYAAPPYVPNRPGRYGVTITRTVTEQGAGTTSAVKTVLLIFNWQVPDPDFWNATGSLPTKTYTARPILKYR